MPEIIPAIPTPQSTNVTAIGPYDPVNAELVIEFKGGRQYLYHDVTLDDYLGLIKADSKGQYINAFFVDVYDFERLR